MGEARHRFLLDLQATQSQAHADRGVARYVKEHVRALGRRGIGEALLLNPHLPFPRALDQDLLTSPILRWNTLSEVRAVAAAGDDRPLAFHWTSPFEKTLRAEGDFPTHLVRGDVPLVATLYDLIPLVMAEQFLADPKLAQRERGRVEQLHHVDLVLAISESARRDALRLLDLDPAKVVTIGAGVSPFFRPEQPGDGSEVLIRRHVPTVTKPYVFSVLGGSPSKNAPRLFEAWAALPSPVRAAHQLVITNSLDPGTRANWNTQLDELDLELDGDVVLTDWQPDVVVRSLYQRAELVVYPTLYDGFGFPVAEAIACGTPVVTSNTSSVPEVLDWPDSTFDPADVGAIASAIERALGDDELRGRLRARGDERRGLFTWDAVAERTEAAYDLLPDGRPFRPRTRLALVGPMPPTPSGIADYNARLLGPLAARADVDLFTPGAPPPHEAAPGVRWLPPRALQETCSPWSYDAVVYTMGNSEHHHETYDLAQEFPGVLWLHDVRLPGLYLTYARERFDEESGNRFLVERLLRQYRRRLPLFVDRTTSGNTTEWTDHGLGLSKELAEVARAIVVSSELAARLVTLDQQPDARVAPAHVVPHAAVPPWGDQGQRQPATAPLLACFGIVAPVKGPELAIAGLAALRGRDIDATLALVGHIDDGYAQHLTRLAEAAGVTEHLVLTGRATDEEYRQWLARATIALQLRLATNGEMSGGVLDCLAAGVPTVTNLPSSDELPAGAVELLPWDVDPSALADRLHALLQSPGRLDELGRAGQSFAATWGYDDVAARLVEIVRSLPAANTDRREP